MRRSRSAIARPWPRTWPISLTVVLSASHWNRSSDHRRPFSISSYELDEREFSDPHLERRSEYHLRNRATTLSTARRLVAVSPRGGNQKQPASFEKNGGINEI